MSDLTPEEVRKKYFVEVWCFHQSNFALLQLVCVRSVIDGKNSLHKFFLPRPIRLILLIYFILFSFILIFLNNNMPRFQKINFTVDRG